jgi:ABC-type antimicrobial peptide transport system permease subunit
VRATLAARPFGKNSSSIDIVKKSAILNASGRLGSYFPVSRRTRKIGLSAALGANPRQVLAQVLSRAAALLGSGLAIGGALLLIQIALWGEDLAHFAIWLGVTAGVVLAAGLLACIGRARRGLRINPTDALKEV